MSGRGVRRALLGFLLVAGSASLVADSTAPDGSLLGIRPYEFPSYPEAPGYTRADGSSDRLEKYWSRSEYERAVTDDRFEFQKLIYASDGLRVVAYVYKPRGEPSSPLPTILFNRGSGVHQDIAPVLLPYLHRLAQEGFVVVAPLYRQSDGGEGRDANGGPDIADLLNLLPLLESLDYVDTNNLFMTGESRGAMMTYLALKNDFPVRAAAVWGGFTDLDQLFEAQPALLRYAEEIWPGFDADTRQSEVERRSAIYWPEAIRTPILLMHGESDGSVPVSHTLALAQRLHELGRLFGLLVFAEDNHVLSQNQVERDRLSVEWFRRFSTEAERDESRWLGTEASEPELLNRAYSHLRRGWTARALPLFRLAVERFPGSWNAHDSLGEALARSGEIRAAHDSYARAFGLAPDPGQKDRIRSILEELARQTVGPKEKP